MAHNDDLQLCALISSRICHDLISPIGAINNGFELLNMSGGDTTSPEMTLITQSVTNADARIRFFRLAFGTAGAQDIGKAEILSILENHYQNARLSVHWHINDAQPRKLVRLGFLAILCLENALAFGGEIHVSMKNQKWIIQGQTDRMNHIDDLWNILKSPRDTKGLTPSTLHFCLLPLWASQIDKDIELHHGPSQVTLQF